MAWTRRAVLRRLHHFNRKRESMDENLFKAFASAGEQIAEATVAITPNSNTRYALNGSHVMLTNSVDNVMEDHLPLGVYIVNCHPQFGYYLTRTEEFDIPKKLYGRTKLRAERFLETFEKRSGTTGVLLAGEKGSGKTLEMKVTSAEGLKRGISTLIVNNSFCGTAFNTFIQAITDPVIVIFDEFEKQYDSEHQEQMLTLLDGTFNSKKLCIFTSNDQYKINTNMINRPGRIFYYIKYKGLDESFIVEYLNDNLKDKSKIESVVRAASFFNSFNFDMLQAVVEEMNRYNETVKDALELLNVKVDFQQKLYYDVELYHKEELLTPNKVYPDQVINPLYQEQVEITHYENESDEDGTTVKFAINKAVANISRDLGRIETQVGEYRLVLKKPVVKPEYDYRAFL